MEFYNLTIGTLAVWRLTHLFHSEDGPWELVVKLRSLAGETVVGKMMDCFYCLSIWVALPFAYALAESWSERTVLWLALSAGAIFCHKYICKEM